MGMKAQFKIQQTAFMVVAVVLFFILVEMFYLVIKMASLKNISTNLEENKVAIMSQFLAQSPEFSCGAYCVDTDRLMVLNSSLYKEFWPVSYIKVKKINSKEDKCSKNNYPDCSVLEVYKNEKIKSSSSIGSFVSLCRHEKINNYPIRVCELGKIIIGYEIK